jgi:hypothetical protein
VALDLGKKRGSDYSRGDISTEERDTGTGEVEIRREREDRGLTAYAATLLRGLR